MEIKHGNEMVDEGSLTQRPLCRALQLPPSFNLTRGGEAAEGQESGVTFQIDEILRNFPLDEGGCSAGSVKEDWFGYYSELSNRELGAGLDNALTSCGSLSEGSSTSATPTDLANDPNSTTCTDHDWTTMPEPDFFHDFLLFDDMATSQGLTPLAFPQFDNSIDFDMPSLMSESDTCQSFLSLDAMDHGFDNMVAIGQGFESLESITDYGLPYEYPSPSEPPTGLTLLLDSPPYPLHANRSLALSTLPSVKPGLELPITTGTQKLQSRLPAVNFVNHSLPPLRKSRDFVCSVEGCKMSYHRRSELHRHKKTHSGSRPHACRFGECDRAGKNGFWRRDHLRQHLRQKHGVPN